MAFAPAVITRIKKKAHFQCCLCKALGIEAHHIVPQSEGGKDTESNAAPLCPSCHEIFGANPTKRKFIREARDLWYEICEKRYAADYSLLQDIHGLATKTVSKADLATLKAELIATLSPTKASGPIIEIGTVLPSPIDQVVRSLSSNDLLVLLYAYRSNRDSSQFQILCLKELWPVKDGVRKIYTEFIDKYGKKALQVLAIKALDESNANPGQGLTEQEIGESLHILQIEAALHVLADNESIRAGLSKDGDVLWFPAND